MIFEKDKLLGHWIGVRQDENRNDTNDNNLHWYFSKKQVYFPNGKLHDYKVLKINDKFAKILVKENNEEDYTNKNLFFYFSHDSRSMIKDQQVIFYGKVFHISRVNLFYVDKKQRPY